MKKLFYIFLAFIFLALLVFSAYKIWWFYQTWPRSPQPKLWSLSELETPEDPEQNAWHFLQESKGDFQDVLEDLPEELNDYAYSLPSEEDPEEFWKQAEEKRSDLANYFENSQNRHDVILKKYEELLGYSQLIDMSKPGLKKDSPPLPDLLDLNRFAKLYVLHLALQGEWQKAHTLLLKQLKLNISWTYSARSLLSQFASLSNLQNNVEFFGLLKNRYPAEQWAEIEFLLRSIQWEQINLKKGIISEYYFELDVVNMVDRQLQIELDNSSRILNPFFSMSRFRGIYRIWTNRWFNPNLIKNRINERFKHYKIALQDPASVDEHFDERFESDRQLRIWSRFFSPNDMFDLLNVPLGKHIREYYRKKAELKLKVQALLSKLPPSKTFESQPLETNP